MISSCKEPGYRAQYCFLCMRPVCLHRNSQHDSSEGINKVQSAALAMVNNTAKTTSTTVSQSATSSAKRHNFQKVLASHRNIHTSFLLLHCLFFFYFPLFWFPFFGCKRLFPNYLFISFSSQISSQTLRSRLCSSYHSQSLDTHHYSTS